LVEFLAGAASCLLFPEEFLFMGGEEGKTVVRESSGEGGVTEPPAIRLPKPLPNLDVVLAMNLFLGDE
jgi:hypothetical protein